MNQRQSTPATFHNGEGASASKRPMCRLCLRAQKACICHCVQQVHNVVEVLILQHTQEAKHIKSSGRLLQLCLQQSQIQVGEQFLEPQLTAWLSANDKQSYLLYPEEKSMSLEASGRVNDAPEMSSLAVQDIRLVVIDASWRQSRQMLRDHPQLQALPRYSLSDMPASRYLIRQAHQTDQLSSLEACCYALMQLEKDNQKFQPLLQAFDAFNQLQIEFGVQRLHRS
jgi:DTW domain-containing protein YfiP